MGSALSPVAPNIYEEQYEKVQEAEKKATLHNTKQ